ncbi:MAG TPA: MFS transporter [Stellaceae bacterium]|nr:MFS transporter [Stellaceae bacterium]
MTTDKPLALRPVGVALTAASLGFALIQLDVTIVNVALPRIGATLGAPVDALQWVVDAYALVFAALLLTGGLLGDRFGARRLFRVGLGVFALASLGCGAAPNAGALIAMRALQGVGAAAMLPSSLALLNHACHHDGRLRARAVGLWTAAGGVTIAAGPLIGGLLIAVASWRTIFLVNLPICAAGAWLTAYVDETERTPRAAHLDLAGQVFAVMALAGLIGGVIELRPLGALHPIVIGAFIVALAAGAAFVRCEARSRAPMVPLRFLRLPSFAPAVGFGILANLTYYGVVFVLSLYLQRVLGYSALTAGLAYLPLTATFIVSNVASGWLAGRVGTRGPMIVGALIGAAGFALLLGLGPHTPYVQMLPGFALIPLGMGLAVPAMTTTVLSSVDKSASGIAAAVLNAARQAGGAVGVAVFGAFAGNDNLVNGLHAGVLTASVAMLAAAGLAAWGIRRRRAVVQPERA